MIKFRNYVPKTAELKPSVVAKPQPASVELAQSLSLGRADGGAGGEAPAPTSAGGFVASGEAADSLGSFVGVLGGPATLDPVSIAPKKANWDLKRDVEARLRKLDRQTQTAIRELVREFLALLCCLPTCPVTRFLFYSGRKMEEEGKTEEEKGAWLANAARLTRFISALSLLPAVQTLPKSLPHAWLLKTLTLILKRNNRQITYVERTTASPLHINLAHATCQHHLLQACRLATALVQGSLVHLALQKIGLFSRVALLLVMLPTTACLPHPQILR